MSSKKDLIRAYKQRIAPMGVFRVANTANGKILIGSSKSLDTKFNSILFQLKIGRFPNPALQADFETCGETKFSYEIIDTLEPKDDPLYNYDDDLKILEELWVDKLKPFGEKGYNSEKLRK